MRGNEASFYVENRELANDCEHRVVFLLIPVANIIKLAACTQQQQTQAQTLYDPTRACRAHTLATYGM